MRHIAIIVILCSIVYFYGLFTNNYLAQFLDIFQDQMLSITSYFETKDWDAINNSYDEIISYWENEKQKLAYIIDHEDVNHLDTLLNRIQAEIYIKNEHLLPDIVEVINYSQQIIEKYDFSWGNIF